MAPVYQSRFGWMSRQFEIHAHQFGFDAAKICSAVLNQPKAVVKMVETPHAL